MALNKPLRCHIYSKVFTYEFYMYMNIFIAGDNPVLIYITECSTGIDMKSH